MWYKGQWKEGLKHGKGCYVEMNGGFKYKGEFKEGKMEGKGIGYMPDGSIY